MVSHRAIENDNEMYLANVMFTFRMESSPRNLLRLQLKFVVRLFLFCARLVEKSQAAAAAKATTTTATSPVSGAKGASLAITQFEIR